MFWTSDPSLNGWWVMAWTSSGLMRTHTWTHTGTDAGNDNTWRPKLALGKKWPAKSTSQACYSHDTAVVFYVTLCYMCSWWCYQMETFSSSLALCVGNSPVTSFHVFSLICAWIIDWVNNREAGDLRRNRAHYAVNVMLCYWVILQYNSNHLHCIEESFPLLDPAPYNSTTPPILTKSQPPILSILDSGSCSW